MKGIATWSRGNTRTKGAVRESFKLLSNLRTAAFVGLVAAMIAGGVVRAASATEVDTSPAPATSATPVPSPLPVDCQQILQDTSDKRQATPRGEAAVPATGVNTLWYDHYRLKAVCDRPMVLAAEDGEFFQVVIKNTDTTQFEYTITAVPDQEVPTSTSGATGVGVPAIPWAETSLTMRHSKIFSRYRVTIGLRSDLATTAGTKAPTARDAAGAAPGASRRAQREGKESLLYPVKFDVWVKTKATFEVAFTGGAAFNSLRSPHYFVRTDDHGTSDTKDDTKTVEEDLTAKDKFRPDTIAVANLRFPDKYKGFGLAFGVGLNNDSDPRYFFGPSYFFGRHFLLHAGWAGGRIDRLPDGQVIGKPPIHGDDTLSSLPKRFAHAFYVGVSFGFVPGSEDAFKGAFGSAQKTAKPGAEKQPEAPESAAAVDPMRYSGTYEAVDKAGSADKAKAKAEISGTEHEDWKLALTYTDAAGKTTGSATLKHTEAATFADAKTRCNFSDVVDNPPTMTCLDSANKKEFEGRKEK
jgi:hypothetical protein